MSGGATRQAIEAVWRIESARLIGGLVRIVRDVGLAEHLAQESFITALERWPSTGIPELRLPDSRAQAGRAPDLLSQRA